MAAALPARAASPENLRRKSLSSHEDDDEEEEDEEAFERFLSRMKTPQWAAPSSPRSLPRSSSSSSSQDPRPRVKDSKEDFLSYLTRKYGSAKKDGSPFHTPGVSGTPWKGVSRSVSRPPPIAFSDSDSEDSSVFIESTPKTPRQAQQTTLQRGTWRRGLTAFSQKERVPRKDSPGSSPSEEEEGGSRKGKGAPGAIHSGQLAMWAMSGSESSDEEIGSLATRLKQRMFFPSEKNTPRPPSTPAPKRSVVEKERAQPPGPDPSTPARLPESKVLADVTALHRTHSTRESSCQVQGCFLQELSDPESQQSKRFQRQKEQLAKDLYAFYNSSVFQQKLPSEMEILWNKKMRKTAGCCVTGRLKEPEGQRYARIMLSEKVCDSADRLRDTLIHELCHAATWLLHGVQDGHGRFWKLYAKKASMVHPELPVVARCHNYEIKYKFTYECSQCRNTIGRHSKSLDTQRFVCALCRGRLVLCQPTRKDGTPAARPLTPFAKYVKENYGSVKRLQQGLSHGAIMKKLSVDFASQEHVLSS